MNGIPLMQFFMCFILWNTIKHIESRIHLIQVCSMESRKVQRNQHNQDCRRTEIGQRGNRCSIRHDMELQGQPTPWHITTQRVHSYVIKQQSRVSDTFRSVFVRQSKSLFRGRTRWRMISLWQFLTTKGYGVVKRGVTAQEDNMVFKGEESSDEEIGVLVEGR